MAATSEASARQELIEHFHDAVENHEDVMAECLSILRLYNLQPSALFYKYEAFLLSRPSGLRAKMSVLTLDTARELRKEIQREHGAKALAAAAGSTNGAAASPAVHGVGLKKGKGAVGVADLGGFLDGLATPVRSKGKPGPRLSNTSNNANVPTPPRTFTPSAASNGTATPMRPTSLSTTTGSSYRPSAPAHPAHLSTPVGNRTLGAPEPSSPLSGPPSPSAASPSAMPLGSHPPPPFHSRPNPHSLVETLNPHLPAFRPNTDAAPSGSKNPRAALALISDAKDWSYRYMFEKVSQRSEALDELIDEFSETMKDAYGLTELGDPHLTSEEAIYTVGRILAPPTDTNKANTTSLLLESSRLLGSGKRIALRFEGAALKVRGGAPGVKGFGLFPGCLVCLKGKNGGGGVFVVEEALMPPPSALPQSTIDELLEYQHGDSKLGGKPLSMMVAAGPFTLEDDLSYEPLEALVNVALEERPDVIILLGPFVDAQHPMIATGAILKMPTDIFRDEVSSRLLRLSESLPGSRILLVPSIRDVVSRHVAFPQAMLDQEGLGLPKRVKLLPNPCTLSINEVLVSITSVDTLFHLRKEEVTQRAEEAEPDPEIKGEVKDPMASLVRHILGQRSFYPIFPPPESLAAEVNLDVTHYHLSRLDGAAPDVLILPSKLKHFSKIVDSTLVVNPSYLSRPHAAGTFAKITVHPTDKAELDNAMEVDGGMREHGIWERARSEIWRI